MFIFVALPSINFPVVVHYSRIIRSELLILCLIFKCSGEERPISQEGTASCQAPGSCDGGVHAHPPDSGSCPPALLHPRVALRSSFIDRIQIGH